MPAADQPTAGVALKHLDLAEQIIAALQESIPAMDAYDEDEIAALESEIASIALPFTRTPASGAVEAAIKALEPFARAAGKLDGLWADDDCRWNDPTRSGVTVAHIRAASTALAALTSSPKAEGEAVPPEVVEAAKRVRRLNRTHTAANGFSEPGRDVTLIVNHILGKAAK